MQFDIKEFHSSISKNTLENAIAFAKQFVEIPNQDIRIIKHRRKSLLSYDNQTWNKKSSHDNFDVTMGSYDEAEVCELVGLFILH